VISARPLAADLEVGPGDILPINQLTDNILVQVVSAINTIGLGTKIAIGLSNGLYANFTNAQIFYLTGTSDTNPPSLIPGQMAGIIGARHTNLAITGTNGVISYSVPDYGGSVYLMWSSYGGLADNYWNAWYLSQPVPTDQRIFNNLYNGLNGYPSAKPSGSWYNISVPPFCFSGSIASSESVTLETVVKQCS